jgi:hypothetical protein
MKGYEAMSSRYSIPFVRPWKTPIYFRDTRLAEFILAAKGFMPQVSDRAILGFVYDCERAGKLALDTSLPLLMADLQSYLASLAGDGPDDGIGSSDKGA